MLDVPLLKRSLQQALGGGGGGVDATKLDALVTTLYPQPKRRKPRRWLSATQKPHVCGINGCTKAYGSASSLCAHKRAHHPGWKTGVYDTAPVPGSAAQQRQVALATGAAAGGGAGSKPPPPSASMPGALATGAGARGGPAGVWLSVLAADATGRLGALRRSRVRAQRSCRDGQQCCAGAAVDGAHDVRTAAGACSQVVVHAASARLCRAMDEAIDSEITRLEDWVMQLDVIAAECLTLGSPRFFALMAQQQLTVGSGMVGARTAVGEAACAAASIAAAATAVQKNQPGLVGMAVPMPAADLLSTQQAGDATAAATAAAAPAAAAAPLVTLTHSARPARVGFNLPPRRIVRPSSGAAVAATDGAAAPGAAAASGGDDTADWGTSSPDSLTLEASPESLQGSSPPNSASGHGDSSGAAPTHPLMEAGAVPATQEAVAVTACDGAIAVAEPLWHRDLVHELEKARAVGDVLALGDDAEVLAGVWPQAA